MKNHLAYLKYVLKHKWYVMLAARKYEIPFLQVLLHDWNKFLPVEWFAYVRTFYNKDCKYIESPAFAQAWNHHQKFAKHHWQYWVLFWDRGMHEPLPMPDRYVREMVADWWGAGRAITGKWEAWAWYQHNKHKMVLHPETRGLVEYYLEAYEFIFKEIA